MQRPTDKLPILHLETEIPQPGLWAVTVTGLVQEPSTIAMQDIRAMPAQTRDWDMHCVWGWVRPGCRWEGIAASVLIDAAGPLPEATHVVAKAIEGPYAACFTISEARESFLAWALDGQQLTPEHGAPLRWLPPPTKWAYKGIKWLGSITLVDSFQPGFWEQLVGNPAGDIPEEMLDLRFE